MTARSAIAHLLAPLALAGVFHALGLPLSCVLALFLPYWGVLLLRAVEWRLREHLPRRESWLLASWGYPAALLAVLLYFGWTQARLPRPAFSFLAGVALIFLWILLLHVLAGASLLIGRFYRPRHPDGGLALLLFFSPLPVSLVVYAVLVPAARILSLPLAAGAILALVSTGASFALLGERADKPPGRPPQPTPAE
jgi:hypothetical protein